MRQTSNLVVSLLFGLATLDQAQAVKLVGDDNKSKLNGQTREQQIEDNLKQAFHPHDSNRPSYAQHGEVDYTQARESQLEDNMKQAFHPFEPRKDSYIQWDLDQGIKKQSNNDDILDYVSEPLKAEREKITQADAQFIKNMNTMDTVKGELNDKDIDMAYTQSNLINRQRIAIEDGQELPMSLAEKRSNTIDMNPLSNDEQSFGGFNLVQWDMMDRSQKSVSNADVEDAVAKPFNLAENIYNEQRAIEHPDLRAQREHQQFIQRYSNVKKPQEDQRFNGQSIGALVENGSAALKLNVAELSGAEEQVEQEDYLMTQWDLDVHSSQNAFDNNDVLDSVHEKFSQANFLDQKRENARNFGNELDNLRLDSGDKTYQELMTRKSSEIPSYMENYDEDNFSKLNIAPITGSEASYGGMNVMVQTGDDNIAFAGLPSLSNQEILYSVTNAPYVRNHKKVDTAQFVGDLDALAQETDPSFAQKGIRSSFKSLDDNLKVHDLSYDEMPNKDYLQWELSDAMNTRVSNNEILGEVFLPQVEKNEDEQKPINMLAQHTLNYIQDKPEMSQLKFGEGQYEVTMNMQPIADEEQQWNGDELAAVQLDQQWIPTMPGDEGSVDFGGQFVATRAAEQQDSVMTASQFAQDVKQLSFLTDKAAAKADQEEQDQKFAEFAEMHKMDGDLGLKIHAMTGTEGQYNGDFEGYTGF